MLPSLSARSWVSRLSILVGLVVPLILIGLVSVILIYQRGVSLADAERNNNAFGAILAEQAERTIQSVDLVMQELVTRFGTNARTAGEGFSAVYGSLAVHDFLADRIKNLPQADALTVVDASGKLVSSSRQWPVPALTFSDRDYFQYLSTHDGPALFVSMPVQDPRDASWTLPIVRRIDDGNGAFGGLILGSLKLGYFADLYKVVTPPGGGTIELLRHDGTILMRSPPDDEHVGRGMSRASEWFDVVAAGGGSYRGFGTNHPTQLLVSVHPMRRYPLVIDTALVRETLLAHWRQESLPIEIGLAVVVLALIMFSLVLNLQFGRLERGSRQLTKQAAELSKTADALGRSKRLLIEKSAALELTLEQMDQGIMLIDRDGTVPICNRKAIELLGLSPTVMAGRPRFNDVLQEQFAAGKLHPGLAQARKILGEASSITAQTHIYDRIRPDGRVIEIRSIPLPAGGAVRTFTDVTARKAAEDKTVFLAHNDALTQLSNRAVFLDRLNEALAEAGAARRGVAVLYLDLDRFKQVNDTRGHHVGDRLLADIANRIRANLRDSDHAARMGGDEFAIIQSRVDQPSSALALSRRLLESIRLPYDIDGQVSRIGTSIGVALFRGEEITADQLLRNADTALYRAKEDGRNNVRFFEPAMDIRHQERSLLEQDLREAVQRRSFSLAYQPICAAATREIFAFEALLRWRHPQRGAIAPSEFIPLAEASGLIVPLGLWVLETACTEAATWNCSVKVAVNLSPLQFRQTDLPDKVAEILLRTGLPGSRLKLEVTEGLMLDDAKRVLATMRALREQGVSIALDDFGTGYASLSYLRRYPFDVIKIDRSFVQSMIDDEGTRAIVESSLMLAAKLELSVVAEGVESEAQLLLLQQLGCRYIQGFLTGRPMPANQIRALLKSAEVSTILA